MVADALILPGRERTREDQPLESDDSQLLPQLHFGPRDAHGAAVGPGLVWLLRRTAQMQNLDSSQRGAVTMETRIRKLASHLQFPRTLALRAIYLFRKARQVHVIKKPSLHHWALALLYTACRDTRYVITIEDLLGNPDDQHGKSTVWGYFKHVKRALGLKLLPFSVENYVTYYAGKIGPTVDGETIYNAIHISRTSDVKANSTPHCVAAGALYIALREAGHNISQKGFCSFVNVSEISLRHWIELLGGYSAPKRGAPELDYGAVPDELQEGQDVNAEREENAEERGPAPPTPEQAERNDDSAQDDEALDDERSTVQKVRKPGKVRLDPRRRAHFPKHSRNERHSASYRKQTRVDGQRVTRLGRARRRR